MRHLISESWVHENMWDTWNHNLKQMVTFIQQQKYK